MERERCKSAGSGSTAKTWGMEREQGKTAGSSSGKKRRSDESEHFKQLQNKLSVKYPGEKFPIDVLKQVDNGKPVSEWTPSDMEAVRDYCRETTDMEKLGFSKLCLNSVVRQQENGRMVETIGSISGNPTSLEGIPEDTLFARYCQLESLVSVAKRERYRVAQQLVQIGRLKWADIPTDCASSDEMSEANEAPCAE
eukprot:TRINITY_DN108061_c0_g1_i1.p1 TRINITY_DN108061_c0_g1~~TRINITY_DN108061_c0_g1_i1.p1  ORF type:complete len:209 (-),score=39.45 TRINITY_DN108061_c0_g1_i1:24-611(-)